MMPLLLAFIDDKKQVLDGEGSYISSHRSMREMSEALQKAGFSPLGIRMTAETADKKIVLAFIDDHGNLQDSAPGPYISLHQSIEEMDVALKSVGITFTRAYPISDNDEPKSFSSS